VAQRPNQSPIDRGWVRGWGENKHRSGSPTSFVFFAPTAQMDQGRAHGYAETREAAMARHFEHLGDVGEGREHDFES
jgi:hypothetical protein